MPEAEAWVRRARPGEEDVVLIPCVYPPPQPPCGTAEGLEEAAGLRRTWLRNGLASDRLRVMLALAPAPSEPFIDYPGVGPIPTEALARGGHIPAGLVEYAPGDYAAEPVEAQGAWVIHCVWVIPPYAGRGIARRLVREVLRDVGADPGCPDLRDGPTPAMAVIAYDRETWWGYFDYMPAAFFARLGFEAIDRDGPRLLMYHAAAPDRLPSHQGSTAGVRAPARTHGAGSITKGPPRLIKARPELSPAELSLVEGGQPDTVDVRVLLHSRCPAAVLVRHTLEAGLGRYPGVRLECIDTRDRAAMRWHGVANGVYVDGRMLLHKLPSPPEIATLLRRAGAMRATPADGM